MPYISASIVVQLMGLIVPYIQKLQHDGESGRNKMNNITRWLTIAICLVQGPAYLAYIKNMFPQEVFTTSGTLFYMTSIVILVAGTIFAMWLGEKITDKGVGNGISLLITVGIVASFPGSLFQEFEGNSSLIFIVEMIAWLIVLALSIILTKALRKVPIQYARRSAISNQSVSSEAVSGSRDFIPLKLNAANVMPIIFAQVIMFIPINLVGYFETDLLKGFVNTFSNIYGWQYNLVFAILIIVFTFFYTALTVKTNDMAEDMKRSGSFVPGIKPGLETADFLDTVLSRITIWGALFLAIIAILPAGAKFFGVGDTFAQFYGGTSLLILVGVTIDTIQQVNSYLLNKKYDGLMKSGRINKAK